MFGIDFSSMFGDTKTIAQAATGKDISPYITTGPNPPSKPGPKKSVFTWENIFSKATDVAKIAGLKMPMDSELAALTAKRKTLVGLQFQMDDIMKKAVPRLAARRDSPASVAAAADLKKTANQAKAQATAALKLIDAAIKDGTLAQEKMKYGTAALKPSATFFTKKAVADKVFSLAKNRLDLVVSSWHAKERQLMATTPLPSSIAAAARDTVVQFGGKVSRGMVSVGKTAETAAESFGEGASAIAPYMKYAPYVLGGFAILYGLQFLPKPRSQD